MPRLFKLTALLTFALAALFYLFFQTSKHNLALSQVNPFAEDPYDAVGSFGIQLAALTALLSMVRAFRPYRPNQTLDGQTSLLVRGEMMSSFSVVVTLGADVVAMIRHPSMWIGLPAGQMLVLMLGGMALLTALVGWLIHRSIRNLFSQFARIERTRAIAICIAGVLVLAFYPEDLRQSLPGAFFIVLVGSTLFIMSVWALGLAFVPYSETEFEDFLDDLAALYRWLKALSGRWAVLFERIEKIISRSWMRPMFSWLNPRKHTWKLVILIGMLIGVGLALAEAIGEGGLGQFRQLAVVAAIFISLESYGVVLGYLLLSKPLGLLRRESEN